MKLGASFALALLTGVLGLSGLASKAHAELTDMSGTICRNYNAAEVLDIDYLGWGVRNLNANPRYVICPVVILSLGLNPTLIQLFVQGETFSGATITCTLSTFDHDGTYLGSDSFLAPRSGSFSQYLSTSATQLSSSTVLCSLPGSAQGLIVNITAVQER
jgi:hypothetical protein